MDKVAGVRGVLVFLSVQALWVCLEWGAQVYLMEIMEEAGEEGGGVGVGVLYIVEAEAALLTASAAQVTTTKACRQATAK